MLHLAEGMQLGKEVRGRADDGTKSCFVGA